MTGAGPPKQDGQFARMSYDLLLSDAFKTLPPMALKLYMALVSRHMREGYTSANGWISMSTQEGCEACGITKKKTIIDTFALLVRRGLIVRTYKGRRINAAQRIASKWEVTDWPARDAAGDWIDATKEYLNWKPAKSDPIQGTDASAPAIDVEKLASYAPKQRASRAKMGAKVLHKGPGLDIENLPSWEEMEKELLANAMKERDDDDSDIPF